MSMKAHAPFVPSPEAQASANRILEALRTNTKIYETIVAEITRLRTVEDGVEDRETGAWEADPVAK